MRATKKAASSTKNLEGRANAETPDDHRSKRTQRSEEINRRMPLNGQRPLKGTKTRGKARENIQVTEKATSRAKNLEGGANVEIPDVH